MWYLEANAKIICRHHLHDCESSRRLIYNFNELTWMLEVDIPLLFILSMTLSMLGPSTRRHCACALGGILISEIIKLLVTLCDRGGVTSSLGTLRWGQMQTRPKQSLIPPHVLTGSTTYHSITHWIPSCLDCQFASHYSLSRDFRFLITPDVSNLQFKECQIWPCTLQVSFYRNKRSFV